MISYVGTKFVSACYACIDLSNSTFRHASAGHWPGFIWRGSEQRMISDTDNKMPIGWSVEPDYPTVRVEDPPGRPISPGTRTERWRHRNSEGSMFGEERLDELIRFLPDG